MKFFWLWYFSEISFFGFSFFMSERYVDPALNMPRVAPPDAPRDEPRAANTARAEEDTDF